MKKYFLSMVVLAIFAIGFAASDETETNPSDTPKTETPQKSEAQLKKEREDALLRKAYNRGKKDGFEGMNWSLQSRKSWYLKDGGDIDDKKLLDKYLDEYSRGHFDGRQ